MAKTPSSLKNLAFEVSFNLHVENCRQLLVSFIDTPYSSVNFCFTHVSGLADGEVEDLYLSGSKVARVLRLKDDSITAPTFSEIPNDCTLQSIEEKGLKFKLRVPGPTGFFHLRKFGAGIFANNYDARFLS